MLAERPDRRQREVESCQGDSLRRRCRVSRPGLPHRCPVSGHFAGIPWALHEEAPEGRGAGPLVVATHLCEVALETGRIDEPLYRASLIDDDDLGEGELVEKEVLAAER